MNDKPEPPRGEVLPETGTAEFYVLSEGLFNLNNSTLMRYTFDDNTTVADYFLRINRRGLGDTANDMALHDSRIYIVVNVSSQIEVIDHKTGESVKRIPVMAENGSSRQPRFITFHQNKAYICCFDGTVARLDLNSLTIDGYAQVGRNPDGICIQNNKIYVSNSGGLDNPDYDNTVSVIDIAGFKEIKRITVGDNPGKIQADNRGNVYVVVRDNPNENKSRFVRIDTRNDEVSKVFPMNILNFAIDDDFAYLYSYNHQTKSSAIKVFNLITETVEVENFIADGTRIQTPFGIAVNPYSKNVYITDAYDYKVKGDVLCFSPDGQLQFRIDNVGINPNTVVFSDVRSQSNGNEGPTEPESPVFASKVLEYRPAPGQFMNTITSAYRHGFAADQVLELATEQLKKRSLITLGGFGGYITVGFDQPVKNIPGEYDFKIYANASSGVNGRTGSSEPGIVIVSKDVNGNGLPDDDWYELAGSEYNSAEAIRNYEITYYRPSTSLSDISWKDNQGKQGSIPRNTAHLDNEYYPKWIIENEITFRGTRLPDNGVNKGTGTSESWVQTPFAWGYADNQPNSSEYSNFKIDWAVDEDGDPVSLDQIDFIRIYTAVNQVCGWMGETSTEISTIEDLHSKKK